jgi:hypothetical protein
LRLRFQRLKDFDLVTQLIAGMQDPQPAGKLSRSGVPFTRSEIGDATHSHSGNEKKCEPKSARYVARCVAAKDPGRRRHEQNDQSCDAPPAIGGNRAPRPRENRQRRCDSQEKQKVIDIYHRDRREIIGRWTLNVERWMLFSKAGKGSTFKAQLSMFNSVA